MMPLDGLLTSPFTVNHRRQTLTPVQLERQLERCVDTCEVSNVTTEYKAIIFDSRDECILMKQTQIDPGGGDTGIHPKYTFPTVSSSAAPKNAIRMCENVRRDLYEQCGTNYQLILLYCSNNEVDRHLIMSPFHIALTAVAPLDQVNGNVQDATNLKFEWIPKHCVQAGKILFSTADDCVVLMTLFKLSKNVTDLQRGDGGARPWQRANWFTNIKNIATNCLQAKYIYVSKDDWHQMSVGMNCTVLRTCDQADTHFVYLKASTNKIEGKLAQYLSSFANFLVKPPIFVDHRQGWYIMHDYGTALCGRFDQRIYQRVIIHLGHMQVKALNFKQQLQQLGVPLTTAHSFKRRLQIMLTALVDRDDFDSIITRRHLLFDLVDILYTHSKLPISIVHGDLFSGNVIEAHTDPQTLSLIDWEMARLDIPFSDVLSLQYEMEEDEQISKKCARHTLRQYLSLWKDFGTVDYLEMMMEAVLLKEEILWLLSRYEHCRDRYDIQLDDCHTARLHDTIDNTERFLALYDRNSPTHQQPHFHQREDSQISASHL